MSNSPLRSSRKAESRQGIPGEKKKSRDEGKRNHTVGLLKEEHQNAKNTTLFSASFQKDAVEVTPLAYQGADANLISKKTYIYFTQADKSLEMTTFDLAKTLNGVGARAIITYKMNIRYYIILRVRHGFSPIITILLSKVGVCELPHVILEPPILGALDFDNQTILAAATDKLNGEIHAIGVNESPESAPQSVAALFHRRSQDEDGDDGPSEDLFIEFGIDTVEEVQASLKKRVQETMNDVISKKGGESPLAILKKHFQIFKIRLGKSTLAKVQQTKIEIEPNSKPIIEKLRRHSLPQKEISQCLHRQVFRPRLLGAE